MHAVEFETIVDSPYIKLENYLDFLHKKIKVIVMSDTKKVDKTSSNSEKFFNTLRNRKLKIDGNLNIDDIMNEMNDGLS